MPDWWRSARPATRRTGATQVRERAGSSKAWRLHEVPGPVPWVDDVALEEQRALLTDSQYARLHLNQWTASEDRLVSVEDLQAAVRLDGPQDYRPGVTYRIGARPRTPPRRTAIAVAHAEVDPSPTRRDGGWSSTASCIQGREGEPVASPRWSRPSKRGAPTAGRRCAPTRCKRSGWPRGVRARGVAVEEWPYTAGGTGDGERLYGLLRDGLLDLYDHAGYWTSWRTCD